jgi:hypothetical protein
MAENLVSNSGGQQPRNLAGVNPRYLTERIRLILTGQELSEARIEC